MPLMDGFETTVAIRQKIDSAVPILALTANAIDWVEGKCKESGMNGYITKPIDLDKLIGTILAHVK